MSLLAPIKPFLKYGMDMKAAVPVVAYYSKMYAVTKGFEIIKADTSGADRSNEKKYLMGELTECETMKKDLPEGTTKEDHRYIVENFVTSQIIAEVFCYFNYGLSIIHQLLISSSLCFSVI